VPLIPPAGFEAPADRCAADPTHPALATATATQITFAAFRLTLF